MAGTLQLHPVETPTKEQTPAKGRPPRRKMPAMPEEILSGMSPLERQHYDYFLYAIRHDYPNLTPSDEISLQMAAIEYVNLMRVQAKQLQTGETITQARQHPGVQLRAWLDSMHATRKARVSGKKQDSPEEADLRAALSALSA